LLREERLVLRALLLPVLGTPSSETRSWGDFKIVDGKYVRLRGGRGCSRSRWDSLITV